MTRNLIPWMLCWVCRQTDRQTDRDKSNLFLLDTIHMTYEENYIVYFHSETEKYKYVMCKKQDTKKQQQKTPYLSRHSILTYKKVATKDILPAH